MAHGPQLYFRRRPLGLVALNTTANPDNPPATFIPTCAGGFTCRTYRTGSTDKGVLMATLCGGVGFQCTSVLHKQHATCGRHWKAV